MHSAILFYPKDMKVCKMIATDIVTCKSTLP